MKQEEIKRLVKRYATRPILGMTAVTIVVGFAPLIILLEIIAGVFLHEQGINLNTIYAYLLLMVLAIVYFCFAILSTRNGFKSQQWQQLVEKANASYEEGNHLRDLQDAQLKYMAGKQTNSTVLQASAAFDEMGMGMETSQSYVQPC